MKTLLRRVLVETERAGLAEVASAVRLGAPQHLRCTRTVRSVVWDIRLSDGGWHRLGALGPALLVGGNIEQLGWTFEVELGGAWSHLLTESPACVGER